MIWKFLKLYSLMNMFLQSLNGIFEIFELCIVTWQWQCSVERRAFIMCLVGSELANILETDFFVSDLELSPALVTL